MLGLIFVSFGPLSILPNIKPPKSDATQQNNNENKSILIWKKIEKIKNRLQKINTYKMKIKLTINIEKFLLKTFFISKENSIIEKMPITIKVNSKTGLYFNINRDKTIRNTEV